MYKLFYTMICKLEIIMELLPNYNKVALIDVRQYLSDLDFQLLLIHSYNLPGNNNGFPAIIFSAILGN